MADKRPNVDDMFARMFTGITPEYAAATEEDGKNVPPSQSQQDAVGNETVEQQPGSEGNPHAQEPRNDPTGKKKAKLRKKPGQVQPEDKCTKADEDFVGDRYRGQTLNKRGKVHASFWLFPDTLEALELRSFLEKRNGKQGEKSEIVEAALQAYLKNELNASHSEIFTPKFRHLAGSDDG